MFNLQSICKLGKDFLAIVSEENQDISSEHLGGGIYMLTSPDKKKYLVACVEIPDSNVILAAQKLRNLFKIWEKR